MADLGVRARSRAGHRACAVINFRFALLREGREMGMDGGSVEDGVLRLNEKENLHVKYRP